MVILFRVVVFLRRCKESLVASLALGISFLVARRFVGGLSFGWGFMTLQHRGASFELNQVSLDQHLLKKRVPGLSSFDHFFYCIIIHIVQQRWSGSLPHYPVISFNSKAELETFGRFSFSCG